jgi:hypothetical protein
MSMKRPQTHSLIPFARVQGRRITYLMGVLGGGRVKRQSGSGVLSDR